jgi:hypothetical protein
MDVLQVDLEATVAPSVRTRSIVTGTADVDTMVNVCAIPHLEAHLAGLVRIISGSQSATCSALLKRRAIAQDIACLMGPVCASQHSIAARCASRWQWPFLVTRGQKPCHSQLFVGPRRSKMSASETAQARACRSVKLPSMIVCLHWDPRVRASASAGFEYALLMWGVHK